MAEMTILDAALAYRRAGLNPLPAIKAEKRPRGINWEPYQNSPATEKQLAEWYGSGRFDAVCLLTGFAGLEVLDFDDRAALEAFKALLAGQDLELGKRLVVERSPSGGMHAFYRVAGGVSDGNQKLACDETNKTLIETRGAGGLVLCAPSPGYTLINGSLTEIPTISLEQRNRLLDMARSLDQRGILPAAKQRDEWKDDPFDTRPGTQFNRRTTPEELVSILCRGGWTLAGQDAERYRLTRPGKRPEDGHSGTVRKDAAIFHNFSANGHPFEPGESYAPFTVVTMLEHNGDFAEAARKAAGRGQDGTGPGESLYGRTPIIGNALGLVPPPPREWIFNGKGGLPRGVVGIVAGQGGCGKTMLAIQLGASVASGTDTLGGVFDIKAHGPVLLALTEDDADEIGRRLFRIRHENGALDLGQLSILPRGGDPRLVVRDSGGNLQPTPGFKMLMERVEEMRPVLIVLDSLSVTAGEAETSNPDGAFVMALLARLCGPSNATVLILTHVSKASIGTKSGAGKKATPDQAVDQALDPMAVRGASSIVNNARWVMTTTSIPATMRRKLGADNPVIAFGVRKTNYSEPLDTDYLENAGGYLRPFSGPKGAAAAELLVKALRDMGPVSKRDFVNDADGTIRETTGLSRDSVRTMVASLIEQGLISERAEGRKSVIEYSPDAPGSVREVCGKCAACECAEVCETTPHTYNMPK